MSDTLPDTTTPTAPAVPVDIDKKNEPMPPERVLLWGVVTEFLKTPEGAKLSDSIIKFFEDWKRRSHMASIWTNVFHLLTLGAVLGVAVTMSLNDKMDPVLAGLLGTLAGYVLGRKSE